MSAIDATQAIAGSLYLVVMTVVGVRLLLLARRTRELPEFLLGLALILGGSVGATLEAGGMTMMAEGDPELASRVIVLGKFVGCAGMTCQALFVQRVFRPNSTAAMFGVAAILALVSASALSFALHGTLRVGEIPLSLMSFEFAVRIIGSTWMFVESLRYYQMMRRRVSLGLAEPIVANRFRLWAIGASLSPLMLASSIPPVLLDPVTHQLWLSLDMLLFAASGIAISGCYLFALMPPAFYRRRFSANAGAEA